MVWKVRKMMGKATLASRSMSLSRTPHSLVGALAFTCPVLDLERKVKRRFAKVSIVSYSRPSLMIIASASQFHIYLPLGQHLFSIVS